MRVMVLVKASAESEAGRLPSTAEIAEMHTFNQQLGEAGVLLLADGLHPSSNGKRVRFDGTGAATVLYGPFAETKELVAGYWIWQVASLEEAAEWLKRSPFRGTEVEIRRIFEVEDFGDNLTPELRESGQQLRDQVAAREP